MSQPTPIEIIADDRQVFAFIVAHPQGNDPGSRVQFENRAHCQHWLQRHFDIHFHDEQGKWNRLLQQAESMPPTTALDRSRVFARVARLISDDRIRVRTRAPIKAAPSKPADLDSPAPPASDMRSQTAAGSGAGAASAKAGGADPESEGATNDDTGPGTDEMGCLGDPVAPVTGEEILILDDFSVAAPMPFQWQRRYGSRRTERDLGLGAGWFAECLRYLWQDGEATWVLDAEARPLRLPPLSPGGIAWQTAAGLRLERKHDDRMMLTEADGRVWTLAAAEDRLWRPISVQDRLGHQWLLAYDERLRLARIDLAPEKCLEFAYGRDDHIQQIQLRQGETRQVLVRYTYDAAGNLTSATTGAGSERYGYNRHQIAHRELPTGYHFLFHWDGEGPEARCIRTHGEDGHYDYRFEYHPEQYLTRVTDAFGNTQVFHYNERERIVARQDPDGGVHQWAYDDQGRLTAHRLPDGRTTHYSYDSRGQLVRERLPDGREHHWRYNPLGLCVGETLPDGRQPRRQCDALGRLLWEVRADGSQWHYHYDANGWLSEAVSDTGETRRTGFDNNGHLLADEHQGVLARFAFDDRGRLKGRLDQDRITEYDYNGDQLSAIHQYPEQAPEQRRSRFYQYDKAGRLTRFTAATGEAHGFGYNGLARPSEYQRPDGKRVFYQYDQEQRLTCVVRSDGERWSLAYDSKGQVIACQAPDGRHIRFSYDAAGNIVHREQQGDWVQHLKRDAGGRVLQQISQGRGRDPVRKGFQYDAFGRRIRATVAERQLSWRYDAHGRVTEHQQGKYRLGYEYGAGQQLKAITLPDATRIEYHYDHQGRWEALAINGDTAIAREFDPQGRERQRRAGNNQQSQVWDRYDCLVKRRWQANYKDQDNGTARTRRYHWDAESRLEGYSDTDEGERRFERDPQGQLIVENDQRFAYDDGGNRLPDDNTELERDRLLRTAEAERRYDALGAETTLLGDTPEYRRFDAEGQLTELRREGLRVQYGTDALNRRAWRQSETGTTAYLWHGDALLGEHRPDGTWQYYIRDPQTDAPLLTLINGTPYYYELDWRSMPIRLWSEQGELVWRANADAWGNCDPDTPNGPIHQPIRLPGQFEDELTGIHHNRFRDYDPILGRYLTPDPLGLEGGLNSYRYTNNPVDFIDPLGLSERESAAQNLADAHAAVGESVLNGLGWVDEKTTIEPLAELQTGAMDKLDQLGVQAVNSGNEWAIPLLGATYAITAAVAPTSALDFVPGGKAGKLGKLGKYSDEAGDGAKHADSARLDGVDGTDVSRNNPSGVSASELAKKPSFFKTETNWTAPGKGTGINYKVYQQEIDWDLEVKGVSNLERAKAGGAPYIMKDGVPQQLQLHHSRQNAQGPLFELSRKTHLQTKKGQGREAVHPYGKKQHPDFPVDRASFKKEVPQYWMDRAKEAQR